MCDTVFLWFAAAAGKPRPTLSTAVARPWLRLHRTPHTPAVPWKHKSRREGGKSLVWGISWPSCGTDREEEARQGNKVKGSIRGLV